MENVIHLLVALISICYLGIGFIFAFFGDSKEPLQRHDFSTRFYAIFAWIFYLFLYLFKGYE